MFDYKNTPVSPDEINEKEKNDIIKKLAQGIVNRRLTAPSIMFLESIKPMNYIGSQLMIFLEPVILSIFNVTNYRKIALILEERDTIEKILFEIENFENEKNKKNKENKKNKKQGKDLKEAK